MFLHVAAHGRGKRSQFGRFSGIEGGRRMKTMLVRGLLAGTVLAGLCYGARHSTFFQLTTSDINASRHISKDEILELTGIEVNANLLDIDPEQVAAAISSHVWVEGVKVEKKWPNTLAIAITERLPVAIVNGQQGLSYVDRRGEMFTRVSRGEELDFPVISGLDRAGGEVDQKLALAEALEFLRHAQSGSASLPKQNISELIVGDGGELTVFLADRPFPIYLGKGKMGQKYSRLSGVLHWLYKNREFEVTESIQFDYQPDKVLVRKSG